MPYPYGFNPYVQAQSNVIRVKGIDGAQAYMGQPGCDYILMDEDENVFYFKHFDALGRPTIRTCDFTIRDDSDEEYATKADLAAINKQLADILGVINAERSVSEASGTTEPKRTRAASTSRKRKSAGGSEPASTE